MSANVGGEKTGSKIDKGLKNIYLSRETCKINPPAGAEKTDKNT